MLSTNHNNIDELYQGYLAKVYQHTQGYQRFTSEQHQTLAKDNVCITYGELLYPSVKKLIRMLSLTSQDVFLDLGSGLGKCMLQVFMQTNLKKVIGIEASVALCQQTQMVLATVKNDFPFYWENGREISQMSGNFLTCDWQDATCVYTCSTCFTQELLVSIGNKINRMPQIQKVCSLRPLPTLQLPLKKIFTVECSWDSALCFYYGR